MTIRDFFRLDDRHPFTGKHMLAMVLAFFGVIISVNVVMAVAATGTFPGLIVKNSYVASQNYNRLLADQRALAGADWRMQAAVAGDGVVTLMIAGGVPQRDLEVVALAGRPSSTHEDRMLAFTEIADGYRAGEALPGGQWLVEVEARRGGNLVFRDRARVFVRGGGG